MALSANSDISANTEKWVESIGRMRTAKEAIEGYGDEMKNIVKNILLEQGISGSVADVLVQKYEDTVLKENLKFYDSFDDQIVMHENSERDFENVTEAAMNIAKGA